MAEEKTFYQHKGVRSHEQGDITNSAKRAAMVDHDEKYGRAGTFELVRFEDFHQKNWREGLGGSIRKHKCSITVVWEHKP
ncbi:MAG TPA: hypothetical protein ENK84_00465 [Desulfobulbus sp.]|nr:hypothetical protein [Desulfobulbus sp.]